MKLKPVENYDEPKYSSFNLKNGKILPTGIAILTALGAISACGRSVMASNTSSELTNKSIVYGLGYSTQPEEKLISLFETEDLLLGKISEKNANSKVDWKTELGEEATKDSGSTITLGFSPTVVLNETDLKESEETQKFLVSGMLPTSAPYLSGANSFINIVKDEEITLTPYMPGAAGSKWKHLLIKSENGLPQIVAYTGRTPSTTLNEYTLTGNKLKVNIEKLKELLNNDFLVMGKMPVVIVKERLEKNVEYTTVGMLPVHVFTQSTDED